MANDKRVRRNDDIRVPEVRVIDADGENIGVISTNQARAKAAELSLDLVEVSPMAKPPVCRIMDYGKYQFEQSKAKQLAKKKQKQIQVKEIKFRPTTEEADYQVKLKKLTGFLEDGNKAKISIRFRGREMAHQDLGMKLMNRVKADLEELGKVEYFPRVEGRQMIMILTPLATKQ